MNFMFKIGYNDFEEGRTIVLFILTLLEINTAEVEYILNNGGTAEGDGWFISVFQDEDDNDIIFDINIDKSIIDNGFTSLKRISKNPIAMKAIKAAVKLARE